MDRPTGPRSFLTASQTMDVRYGVRSRSRRSSSECLLFALRKLGHELSDIWNEFKLQTSDPSLARFDAAVSALNEYEELRYPNSVLNKGMLSGFELKRGQAAQVSGLAAAVPRYTLCLEDVDELMSLVFKNASVNPGFFTGSLKKEAKRFLSKENVWSVV